MLRVGTSVELNLTCSFATQGAHVRPRLSLFPPFFIFILYLYCRHIYIYFIYLLSMDLRNYNKCLYRYATYFYFISPPIHNSFISPIFVLKKLAPIFFIGLPFSLSSPTVFLCSNPTSSLSPFWTSQSYRDFHKLGLLYVSTAGICISVFVPCRRRRRFILPQ